VFGLNAGEIGRYLRTAGVPFDMLKVCSDTIHVLSMGANGAMTLDATHLAFRVRQGFVNADGIPFVAASDLAFEHHLKHPR
jgi:hypothetical protein